MTDIQPQVNTLPQQIQDILYSQYQRILAYKIRHKYKYPIEIRNAVEDVVASLFNGSQKISDLASVLQNTIKSPKVDFAALARDIVGMRLYIATPYFKQLGQDIETFITVNGSISEEYKKNAEIFKRAIADEKAGTYDHDDYFHADEPEMPKKSNAQENDDEIILPEDLDSETMKMHLEKFFEESLDDLLSMENSPVLSEINENLATSLSVNEHLARELTQILEKNQSRIGETNIILDDKELPPTVSNWLKDFFGVAGTEHFDTLSIAKYIISSENAKNLNPVDQAKLRRFLGLYYNINFFPAPFNALPVSEWEIIPGVNVSVETKTEPAIPAPIITERPGPKPIERQPKWSVPKPAPASVAPTPNIAVSQNDSADIIELKKMLEQYPAGSLERSAIEEELKLLEHK